MQTFRLRLSYRQLIRVMFDINQKLILSTCIRPTNLTTRLRLQPLTIRKQAASMRSPALFAIILIGLIHEYEQYETLCDHIETIDTLDQCQDFQSDYSKIANVSMLTTGELLVEIAAYLTPSSMAVVWYATNAIKDLTTDTIFYESSADRVSCSVSRTGSFRIGPLLSDVAYTVCVVNKFGDPVSPLDCMPYYRPSSIGDDNGNNVDGNNNSVWIWAHDRDSVIGLVTFIAVLSLLFGIGLAVGLIRCNVERINSKQSVMPTGRHHPPELHDIVSPSDWQRMAGPYRHSDSSTITASLGPSSPASTTATQHKKQRAASQTSSSSLLVSHVGADMLPTSVGGADASNYYLDYLSASDPPPLPPPNSKAMLRSPPPLPESEPSMLYGMCHDHDENDYSLVGPIGSKF